MYNMHAYMCLFGYVSVFMCVRACVGVYVRVLDNSQGVVCW